MATSSNQMPMHGPIAVAHRFIESLPASRTPTLPSHRIIGWYLYCP